MNEALQPLVNLLAGKFGWWPTALAWVSALMTASRVLLKPFSAGLQARLTAKMYEAANSPEHEDDVFFESLLQANWYRLTCFVLDLVFSFKLPTWSDFQRAEASATKSIQLGAFGGAVMKLVMIGMVSALVCTGCQTQGAAAKSIATVAETVDATMKGWAVCVVNEQVTPKQEEEVKALYAKYQAAMEVANDAYAASLTTQDMTRLRSAVTVLTACEADLLRLIKMFKSENLRLKGLQGVSTVSTNQ